MWISLLKKSPSAVVDAPAAFPLYVLGSSFSIAAAISLTDRRRVQLLKTPPGFASLRSRLSFSPSTPFFPYSPHLPQFNPPHRVSKILQCQTGQQHLRAFPLFFQNPPSHPLFLEPVFHPHSCDALPVRRVPSGATTLTPHPFLAVEPPQAKTDSIPPGIFFFPCGPPPFTQGLTWIFLKPQAPTIATGRLKLGIFFNSDPGPFPSLNPPLSPLFYRKVTLLRKNNILFPVIYSSILFLTDNPSETSLSTIFHSLEVDLSRPS